MSKNTTAQKTGQASNVIFIHCPHDSDPVNADAATGSAAFTDCPRGRKENEKEKGVNGECERFIVPAVPLKELKTSFHREYNSYRCMKYRRCGKNGKYICHPDIAKFPQFLAAFGPIPGPGYTLDRIDPTDLEYASGKCEWASKQRQAENKSNTKYLTSSDGTCLHVSEWSRRSGIPRKTIHRRINELGWSVDEAVGIKAGGKRSPSSSQDKPRTKSLFPDAAPTPLQTMLYKWTWGLKDYHDCPEFLLEWKHIRMLEYIHEGLYRCKVSPDKVVEFVVKNWYSFAVEQCYSHFSKPAYMPDLSFLKAHIMDAAEYYLSAGGERLPEVPDQKSRPVVPGEFDGVL